MGLFAGLFALITLAMYHLGVFPFESALLLMLVFIATTAGGTGAQS